MRLACSNGSAFCWALSTRCAALVLRPIWELTRKEKAMEQKEQGGKNYKHIV